MKVAILADIHGNAYALKAVLEAARTENVSRLLIAGDFVGYYFDPVGVLEQLAEWQWVGVRGNHEEMLFDWIVGKNHASVRARYGVGIECAAAELPNEKITLLESLPTSQELDVDGHSTVLCHGSPWDEGEYVYPDADMAIRERMIETGHSVVIYGHTHYPAFWEIQGSTVINPGSVGQPRDGIPGACWVLWNTMDSSFDFRRQTYDCAALIEECHCRGADLPYLAEVLLRVNEKQD